MQTACRALLAPYVRQRPEYTYHTNIRLILARFRHTGPSHATPTPFRPIAFYSLHPLPESGIPTLQSKIKAHLQKLGVVGRIYLASDKGIGGINAQLSVPVRNIGSMQSFFDTLPEFKGVSFEYNSGMEETDIQAFGKLKVMKKPHLVAVDNAMTKYDLSTPPIYLSPEQWHKRLSDCDKDTLLIDMRNHYEYEVGRFKNAIKMDVDTFRESLQVLDGLVADRKKDEAIYMYCTGGIRCSVAGAYISKKGYTNVNMLKGGITSYGHYIKKQKVEDPLFQGSNFTFDGRRGERITDDILARCHQCGAPCDALSNCANTMCHLLFIQCDVCRQKNEKTCSSECRDVILGRKEWTREYNYRAQIRPSIKLDVDQRNVH